MWGGRFSSKPAELMQAINVSIGFDKRLAAQDLAGSRAHAARATIDAQTLAREAARAAELQRKAEELAPPPPVELPAPAAAHESPYARMGYVDDAEIEAHVRRMLTQRAAG